MDWNRSKSGPKTLLKRFFVYLIEDIRWPSYGVAFVGLVLAFAVLYYILSPTGEGIGQGGVPNANLTFWDAAYFSVVTTSSLGYGDMYPMGAGKLFASIQVLLGLLLMGIMLAKLTSARLLHHVSRLYGTELQRRLDIYADDFHTFVDDLKKLHNDGVEFFILPTKGSPARATGFSSAFGAFLEKFHSRYTDLMEYIEQETDQGAFFSNAPKSSLNGLASNIDEALYWLCRLINDLPRSGKDELFSNRDNRRRTSEVRAISTSLYEHVTRHNKDTDITRIFKEIKDSATRIPEAVYSTPEVVEDSLQPDQVFGSGDEPQMDKGSNP